MTKASTRRAWLGLFSALAVTCVTLAGRPASAQPFTETFLEVVQDNKLWEVDVRGSAFATVGTHQFLNTTSMSNIGGNSYIISDGKLWVTNDYDGTTSQLGSGRNWTGPTNMDSGPDNSSSTSYLWVTQDSRLWRVNPSDGTFSQRGGVNWSGATSLTHARVTSGGVTTNYVFIIQDSRLWRVNPNNGAFTQLGGADWAGAAQMTFDNSVQKLFIVQDSSLWGVSPNNGSFTRLGAADWAGATSIASGPYAELFIIQDSRIFRVDATNGSFSAITGKDFGGTTRMSVRVHHDVLR